MSYPREGSRPPPQSPVAKPNLPLKVEALINPINKSGHGRRPCRGLDRGRVRRAKGHCLDPFAFERDHGNMGRSQIGFVTNPK